MQYGKNITLAGQTTAATENMHSGKFENFYNHTVKYLTELLPLFPLALTDTLIPGLLTMTNTLFFRSGRIFHKGLNPIFPVICKRKVGEIFGG